jgi:hypothetical protein
MKNLIICSMILVLSGVAAFAEVIPSTPDPASVAYGARPLGMGGAFVSIADDTNAIFTNPAGLGTLLDWSITSMSTQLLQSVDYRLAAATFKVGPGSLGVGYIGTSTPCGDEYDSDGNLLSSSPISYNSSLVLISYGVNMANVMKTGRSMGNVSVGGTVKAISMGFTGIDGASASGVSAGIGLKIEPNNSPFSYGASISNIGSSVNWGSGAKENIEGSAKLGASAKVIGENALNKSLPGELIAALDIELLPNGKPMALHAGAEYKAIKMLSVRLGLDQDPVSPGKTSSSLTAGVGIEFSGFRFDYAYRMNPDAQELSNHYFSLSYAPEVKAPKMKKGEPEPASEVKEKDSNKSKNIYKLPKEYENIGF